MIRSEEPYRQISAPEQPLISTKDEQTTPSALLLFLISTVTIGSHYGKHSLASLSTEIMAVLGSNRTKYGLLFSSQQLPGLILPIFGGFALTYVPHGPAGVALSSTVTLSTAFCALAVTRRSYGMLVLGRLLFGICDGALTTLQGAIVAHALRNRIGAGFGFMLFVSRLSSFAGLTLPAIISSKLGLEFSMWFSVVVCVPPLLSTIAYAFKSPPRQQTVGSHRNPEVGLLHIREVFASLSVDFWFICYLWIVVAGVVFSMTHFIPDALSQHFQLTSVQSGFLSGGMVLTAGLCSPALGILQDRIGRRALIMAACCVSLLVGSVMCAQAVSNSRLPIPQDLVLYLALIFIGCGFSAAPVTLLACVAIVVDEVGMPAALGVYKAAENGGLAVIHLVIGILRDWSGAYVSSFLFLGLLSFSGVVISRRLAHNLDLETRQDSTDQTLPS